MIVLNERERRVLLGLGLVLLVGGVVRLVGATWPRLTPGLVAPVDEARVPPPASEPAAETDRTGPGSAGPARPGDGPGGAPRLGRAADVDSLFPGGKLDLNAAGERELRLLPGIGPALAGRVVELRRARGGFTRVDELLDVRGVGPSILGRIRPHVVVTPRTAEPGGSDPPEPGTGGR